MRITTSPPPGVFGSTRSIEDRQTHGAVRVRLRDRCRSARFILKVKDGAGRGLLVRSVQQLRRVVAGFALCPRERRVTTNKLPRRAVLGDARLAILR
jgi:hypothetical protein